jgi:phosphate transport system substrate-binding protein
MRKKRNAFLYRECEKCGIAAHIFPTLVCLIALLCLTPFSAYANDHLIVGGSGNNLAGIELLARAFHRIHPDVVIDVPASLGSTGGIRAAAEGAVSLGLISRPLRRAERDLGLTVVAYARTAIVIGVNATVPDSEITSGELLDIYAGKKTVWQNGREIIVFLRDAGDSTTDLLKAMIPGFTEVYRESQREKRWITLYTDQDMNKMIVATPYSIGFSDTGSIATEYLPIKILALNGIFPSPKNILEGKYPLVKTLSFVFMESRLSAAAKAFVDFVRSREAARILRQHGYLAVD